MSNKQLANLSRAVLDFNNIVKRLEVILEDSDDLSAKSTLNMLSDVAERSIRNVQADPKALASLVAKAPWGEFTWPLFFIVSDVHYAILQEKIQNLETAGRNYIRTEEGK